MIKINFVVGNIATRLKIYCVMVCINGYKIYKEFVDFKHGYVWFIDSPFGYDLGYCKNLSNAIAGVIGLIHLKRGSL